MNWYIGMQIVAIKDHNYGFFKEGEVFTIKALRSGPCDCSKVIIDVGHLTEGSRSGCSKHQVWTSITGEPRYYAEWYFAPLDELADISELLEVLEMEAFK